MRFVGSEKVTILKLLMVGDEELLVLLVEIQEGCTQVIDVAVEDLIIFIEVVDKVFNM